MCDTKRRILWHQYQLCMSIKSKIFEPTDPLGFTMSTYILTIGDKEPRCIDFVYIITPTPRNFVDFVRFADIWNFWEAHGSMVNCVMCICAYFMRVNEAFLTNIDSLFQYSFMLTHICTVVITCRAHNFVKNEVIPLYVYIGVRDDNRWIERERSIWIPQEGNCLAQDDGVLFLAYCRSCLSCDSWVERLSFIQNDH